MTRSLRATQYACMAALGMAMTVVPPLVPAIRDQIHLSYLQAGMVFSGQFLGMILTVPFGGHLADRFGKKPFLVVSGLLIIAGLAGFAAASGFASLLLTSVIAGAGTGGYEVGSNALEADHTAGGHGTSMNLLHLFYGVGAMAGPALSTLVVQRGWDWRVAPALTAAAPALVTVALLVQPVGKGVHEAVHETAAVYRSGALWICSAAIAVYVGIEVTVMGWSTTFWEQRAPGSAVPASLVPAAFWLMVTLGRLVCAPVTDRVGLLRFVRVAAAAVLAVGLAWTIAPGPAVTLAAVVLLGLGLAGIFPTVMAHATVAFPGHAGKVVALLAVFASLGGFFIPSAVGRVADAQDIGVLPPIVAALAAALLLVVRLIPRPAPAPAP
ncbi:MAG: MFS transporter [Anaeromyxobacter sp.]